MPFLRLLPAYAFSYELLYIARMIGGLAFGAALILAPMYIAEISSAENRGMLVSTNSEYRFGLLCRFFEQLLFQPTQWRSRQHTE